MYAAISNLCEQFGLTTNEQGQETHIRKRESVTNDVLTSENLQEVNLFRIWKQFVGKHSGFQFKSLSETIQFTTVCEEASHSGTRYQLA